jgi:hypothetical protein
MNKLFGYLVLSVVAIMLITTGTAYARGWFWTNESPEDITARHQAMFKHKAELFGISAEEMKDAWSEGKRMFQIAEEYGLNKEEIMEKMAEDRRVNLQERLRVLVENDIISQEQANQRMEVMQNKSFGGIKTHRGFNKPFRGDCPHPSGSL